MQNRKRVFRHVALTAVAIIAINFLAHHILAPILSFGESQSVRVHERAFPVCVMNAVSSIDGFTPQSDVESAGRITLIPSASSSLSRFDIFIYEEKTTLIKVNALIGGYEPTKDESIKAKQLVDLLVASISKVCS